jgi:outer membrane murein-binding lipoprotein Lpp
MGTLGGILLVLGIISLAGVIAYIGDRVGHQVGRKRLTLFGLRPKYTSTIVAVATGMMIALVVVGTALLASGYARAAFFRLGEINNRVNELEAQAEDLNKRVHETNVVINRGDLLYGQFLPIAPTESAAQRLTNLETYFDAVVAAVNRRYVPLRLKPYLKKSSDPDVTRKLQAVLDDPKVQGFLLRGPVLLMPVADQNLFVNDEIHFTFAPYADELLFTAHQPIVSIEVDGGVLINPGIAYGQALAAAQETAVKVGMPTWFARPLAALTEAQVEQTTDEIRRGRGKYYIVARAAVDVFPHTGGFPVEFVLSRTPK